MGQFFNNPFTELQHCGTDSPIDDECVSSSTSQVRDNVVYLQVYDQVYFEIPDPNGGRLPQTHSGQLAPPHTPHTCSHTLASPVLGADAYPDCTLANFYSYARVNIQKLHEICPNHISRLREKWLFPVSLFEHFDTKR